MRQGAASIRKIGGDLQGEPRLPVDATSARVWQGSDDTKGVCKHGFRRTLTTLGVRPRNRLPAIGSSSSFVPSMGGRRNAVAALALRMGEGCGDSPLRVLLGLSTSRQRRCTCNVHCRRCARGSVCRRTQAHKPWREQLVPAQSPRVTGFPVSFAQFMRGFSAASAAAQGVIHRLNDQANIDFGAAWNAIGAA